MCRGEIYFLIQLLICVSVYTEHLGFIKLEKLSTSSFKSIKHGFLHAMTSNVVTKYKVLKIWRFNPLCMFVH